MLARRNFFLPGDDDDINSAARQLFQSAHALEFTHGRRRANSQQCVYFELHGAFSGTTLDVQEIIGEMLAAFSRLPSEQENMGGGDDDDECTN